MAWDSGEEIGKRNTRYEGMGAMHRSPATTLYYNRTLKPNVTPTRPKTQSHPYLLKSRDTRNITYNKKIGFIESKTKTLYFSKVKYEFSIDPVEEN